MISDRLRGATGYWLPPGYHGLVNMGTLVYGEDELDLPTRPWSDGTSFDGNYGNIPNRQGTNLNDYDITDTSSDTDKILKWHLFVDRKRYVYVCDRNILSNVSWLHLLASNFVTGKWVEIDGVHYWCRILTGGVAKRDGSEDESSYDGGRLPNEWDRFIMNEGGFDNIDEPQSSDYDVEESLHDNNTVRQDDHNQTWHWIDMASWCVDDYAYYVSHEDHGLRAMRGRHSARHWDTKVRDAVEQWAGWRPVLIK